MAAFSAAEEVVIVVAIALVVAAAIAGYHAAVEGHRDKRELKVVAGDRIVACGEDDDGSCRVGENVVVETVRFDSENDSQIAVATVSCGDGLMIIAGGEVFCSVVDVGKTVGKDSCIDGVGDGWSCANIYPHCVAPVS